MELFIKESQKDNLQSLTIADDVEVKGAELKDGLLRVSHGKNYSRAKSPKLLILSNF